MFTRADTHVPQRIPLRLGMDLRDVEYVSWRRQNGAGTVTYNPPSPVHAPRTGRAGARDGKDAHEEVVPGGDADA